MEKASTKLNVQGIEVGIYTEDFRSEYISLTDIAKYQNVDDPRFVIRNWMKSRDAIEFLGLWEILHNPNFKRTYFDTFKNEAGKNAFTMSPEKWISATNAIGITTKRGRYNGGTYAHSDIAMSFATWISPEFQLYLMQDYRRLKEDENSQLSLNWNINRAVAKLNYRIHTDAIKENLLPPELTNEQIAYTYANEADLLNVALFGTTASEWRKSHRGQQGNIRDNASLQQLLVLANLESYNAALISQQLSSAERLPLLRKMAVQQLKAISGLDDETPKLL